MKNLTLLLILIFGYLVDTLGGSRLMKPCSPGDVCPPNSSCRIRGCDGKLCICNDGLMPSDDYQRCLKIVEIGQKCNVSYRCRGLSTRCNGTNICECQSGYIPSLSGSYCKQQPMLGTLYSLLGEECDGERKLCVDINTVCNKSSDNPVCICKKGFRHARKGEKNAYPFNIVQCVPSKFELDVTIQPSNCFTPFQVASVSSSYTDLQQVSTTLLSSQPDPLSSVSTKQTMIIKPTSSSQLLESLLTETSTPLTASVTTILSTFETDLSTVELSTLQTASPNSENTLSNMRTNMPTDTNTISYTQTKSDTLIIHSSIPEFKTLATSQSGSMPTKLLTLNSQHTVENLESSSLFSERFIQSSSIVTPEMTILDSQLSTKGTVVPSLVVNPTDSLSLQETLFMSTPEIKSLQSTFQSSESVSQNLSLSSTEGSQITSPLPFTKSISTPSHYSNDISMSMSQITTINPSSSMIYSWNTTTPIKNSSPVSTPGLISTTPKKIQSTSILTAISSKYTSTTPKMVTIQRQCKSATQCPENAECQADQCGEHRCRCRLGYVENSKSTKCLKLVPLGSECDQTTVCIGRHTRCYKHKCNCVENYEASSNHKWCRRQKSWFISFPLLGDICSNFFADCYNSNEQICTSGSCRCRNGLREKDLDDIKADSKSLLQCINDTITTGFRETEVCRGQIKHDEPDQNEPEAARKIKIMKGAIIGGVLSLLVLITSVIGIVCFVRYRRRTMIKDMASDHGSVVSFDRQSSGKYSFKMPRPFRLFTAEKEYESEHINYNNSMFEQDEANGTVDKAKLETQRSNGPFTRTLQLDDIDFSFKGDKPET